jgi:2,4-dichlorophenol 6-monooxygenase
LGQRYISTAVVSDGTPEPPAARDPDLYHVPTTHPGAHLPHVWLERDAAELSTLDLCSYDRFTLFVGADGDAWTAAAAQVAAAKGVAIDAVPVGLGLHNNDVLGKWIRSRDTTDRGCLLVRPDRVVAWRCADTVSGAAAVLGEAMTTMLGR